MKSRKPPELDHLSPPWFHKKWKELREFLLGIIPREGDGIRITDAPGEGGLKIDVVTSGFNSIIPPRPFELRLVDSDHVKVTPGTVNNDEPVTIGGSEDWVFDIGPGETKYVYLAVDVDESGLISAPELLFAEIVPDNPEGNPETGTAPPRSYRKLGRVARVGAGVPVLNSYLLSSQWVTSMVAGWSCDEQKIRMVWCESILLP